MSNPRMNITNYGANAEVDRITLEDYSAQEHVYHQLNESARITNVRGWDTLVLETLYSALASMTDGNGGVESFDRLVDLQFAVDSWVEAHAQSIDQEETE